MKKLLFLLLTPVCYMGYAQQFPEDHLAENRIDENAHDTIRRTYWQVMERSGLSRKLNTFYRFSRINDELFLDLKVTEGGCVFVVPRDAEMRLILEDGTILLFNNTSYKLSCAGCGARGAYSNTSAEGVILSFPVSDYNRLKLLRTYIAGIGINSGSEDYKEKKVTPTHSEIFVDQLRLICDAPRHLLNRMRY